MSDLNYVRERWLDTRYSMHYVDGEQKAVLFVDDANFLMREGLEFLDRIVAQERELAALRRVRDAALKSPKFLNNDKLLGHIEGCIIENTGDGEFAAYVVQFLMDMQALKAALESEAPHEHD